MTLEIIYEDEALIAINKPHGLLVHKSAIAKDASEYALQLLRDQINAHVYLCHRLDRKTSGVLLFTKNKEVLPVFNELFMERKVSKVYHAIVRGFTDKSGTINYPLKNDRYKTQEAITGYETQRQTEIEVPFLGHSTSRYSLVKVSPETGRMHQIRKHFAHIYHPIIGDRPHGCNKQNRLFKEKWGITTMMLQATCLTFKNPIDNKMINISAPYSAEFKSCLKILTLV